MLTKLNRTSTIPDALNPPALESLPAATNARLEQFRKLRKEWSAQGHPLGIALDKLRTPDLVRAIEAKA